MEPRPDVQVLLPVHNEAESIEGTVREIYEEFSARLKIEFIICEDGSRDNTQEVLTALSKGIPMKLIMSKERKGYSRAVRDGMEAMDAPYLLCVDSDGQCDPKDFWKLWDERQKYDVVLGWRVNRADTFLRKFLSGVFHIFYQLMFHPPVHDPSCPYMLASKDVIKKLVGEQGLMQQGFWWEFVARVHRRGYTIHEVPVNHRLRTAGTTQVYKFSKMPGIFIRHFLALFKIRAQTREKYVDRTR